MREDVKKRLLSKVRDIIKGYSDTERECNYNQEIFSLKDYDNIHALGEYDAAVILNQSSGYLALFRFIYIPAKERWEYFVPTASHNMDRETELLYLYVEKHNLRYFWEANR